MKILSAALTGAAIVSAAALSMRGSSHDAALPATQSQPATVLTPSTTATVHDAPQGRELGRVSAGAQLTVLARDRGWVRVRSEGWIQEDQLIVADSALRMSPSAADIRADPAGMKGRVVRWEMEFIAFQRSDQLRKDMTAEEWYILARGPVGENAIVYLVVPPNLRSMAESITPLNRILVTARVRVGRSQPVGVPILDIESMSRR